MFSVDDRNNVYMYVLELAHADPRIVAGAVVGSLALSEGDRWSDLDLSFSVKDDMPISEVLEDWTYNLVGTYQAVQLFDLPSGDSIYRVFLLPGCLQFDLSFTPASRFGARGMKFKLLFASRPRWKSYSGMRFIISYGRASVSSVAGTGRPNIGLAVRVIMHSTWLHSDGGFPRSRAGASMSCHMTY
jgi:hypothetical protein